MTPIPQTKFGAEGNCFDACVASLLDIPLASISYMNTEEKWYADFQKWLAPRGLAYVEIDCVEPTPFYRFPTPVLAIGGGPSPRGEFSHAVIVRLHRYEKKIVHDPHPDGTGITAIKTLGFFVRAFGE